MIWLLLFGSLFERVVEIPGFRSGSYLKFLTHGIVVMNAVSSAGSNGMVFDRRHALGCDGPTARLAGSREVRSISVIPPTRRSRRSSGR